VDKGGQTLSATEFAALTGVSRDRLRTWERRHGFPEPVRSGNGPRRYARSDIARVVAVRRAAETGVPIPDAIAGSNLPTEAQISLAARAALADDAPVAVVVLSGPEPLRVEYVNGVVAASAGAPQAGDEVFEAAPWFQEHPGADVIRRVFTGSTPSAECEHPDWTDAMRSVARSVAFRLPHETGRTPLVGLIGIDTQREREARDRLADLESDYIRARSDADTQAQLAGAALAVAEIFRRSSGTGVLSEAATVMARRLGAVDAALAPSMAGALVLGRSARGLLGPEMVTVARFEDLATVMRDGEAGWVSADTASAFGVPAGTALLAAGLVAGGEALGALLVVFDEQRELSDTERDLLRVVSAVIALGLVRERVAGQLQDP
jgi:predicted DNA-binding transcriptional regulator AlpA